MPRRNSLRLRNYDYASAGAYFITVRTRAETVVLGRVVDGRCTPSAMGIAVERCWSRLPRHLPAVETDAFALLPDHVHGIVVLGRAGQAPPLQQVVGAFKSCASRSAGIRLWQRGYHDRVIRNEAELESIRRYVTHNVLKPRL